MGYENKIPIKRLDFFNLFIFDRVDFFNLYSIPSINFSYMKRHQIKNKIINKN